MSSKTVVAFLAVTVIVGILFWLSLPCIDCHSKPTMEGNTSRNRLKNIALGISFFEIQGTRLPRYIADKNGKPLLSWRVAILPHINQHELYQKFKLDEPWDSPHNLPLAHEYVEIFHCPKNPRPKGPPYETGYVAITGPGTVWDSSVERPVPMMSRDFDDVCVLIAEMYDSGIIWTEPRDLDASTMRLELCSADGPSMRGAYGDGANVALTNHGVFFLSQEDAGEDFLRDLVFRRGTPQRPEKRSRQWLELTGRN